jgi:hypothetical protein
MVFGDVYLGDNTEIRTGIRATEKGPHKLMEVERAVANDVFLG